MARIWPWGFRAPARVFRTGEMSGSITTGPIRARVMRLVTLRLWFGGLRRLLVARQSFVIFRIWEDLRGEYSCVSYLGAVIIILIKMETGSWFASIRRRGMFLESSRVMCCRKRSTRGVTARRMGELVIILDRSNRGGVKKNLWCF
jgi:hypothetical protein